MNGVSIWQDAKTKKWVAQVRLPRDGQKPLAVQRRANSKKEANQIALDLRLNASSKLKASSAGKLTFEQLLAKYQEQRSYEVQPSTLANYVHLLKLYAFPSLGKKHVSDITAEDISKILNGLRNRNLTVTTVNTVRSRLIDIFRFAQERRFIEQTPTQFIKRHKSNALSHTNVKSPWTRLEAQAALAAFRNTRLDVFMAFAIGLGMRKGEILGLRWSDIDFNSQEIGVQRSRGEKRILNGDGNFRTNVIEGVPKTESSTRVLPLTPEIKEALSRLANHLKSKGIETDTNDHLVVTEENNPISLSTLHRTYTQICMTAGLRRIRIHDIRHTVAVVAIEAGSPLLAVSEAFGHAGIEITRRTYAPKVPGLAKTFATKMSEALKA